MSSLGTVQRERATLEEVLRSIINAIQEEKEKHQSITVGGPTSSPTVTEKVELAVTTIVTSVAAGGFKYDDAVLIMRFPEGTTALPGLTGSQTVDSSGYKNHGDLASIAFTTGKFGLSYALDFNGSTASAVIADTSSITPATSVTVFAWVYRTAAAGGREAIMGKRNSGENVNYYLSLQTSYAEFAVAVGTGTNVVATDTVSLSLSTWVFLTGTFNGSSVLLYRDGVLITSTNANTSTITTSTRALRLGSDGTNYWRGMIDEPRIYPRANTTTEITRAFNNIYSYWNRADYE